MCTDKSIRFVKPDKKLVPGQPILSGIERHEPTSLKEKHGGRRLAYPMGE
jgi:hypothetical protein